jgi:Ca2+-binding EF-hand superfamily protein
LSDFELTKVEKSKKHQPPSYTKKLEDCLSDQWKHMKPQVKKEHYHLISGDGNKLQKARFKNFLAQRYGMNLAEKLQAVLDFNGPVGLPEYQTQIESIIKERTLLLQIAFDIFDSNNDDKISELDLFKALYNYNQGPNRGELEKVFLLDICQMCRQLNRVWAKRL